MCHQIEVSNEALQFQSNLQKIKRNHGGNGVRKISTLVVSCKILGQSNKLVMTLKWYG